MAIYTYIITYPAAVFLCGRPVIAGALAMEAQLDRIQRIWRDERAAVFLEYGILVCLIVAANIGTVQMVGHWAGGQGAFPHAALP